MKNLFLVAFVFIIICNLVFGGLTGGLNDEAECKTKKSSKKSKKIIMICKLLFRDFKFILNIKISISH